MRIKKSIYSLSFILVLIFGVGSNANATAVGLANAFFDFDSLQIVGDVDIDDAELETFVEVANENGLFDSIQFGDISLSDSESDFNTDAFAGNDGTDFLGTSTSTDSLFADATGASASSELSVFIPFFNLSSGMVDISFDYDLFVTADTEATGEYAIASSGLSYSLLDEFLDEISFIADDLFVEAFDGSLEDDSISSFFSGSYNLGSGQYYVAIDLFSDSFTEAFAPVAAVPAPGTLILMLAGLFFLNRRILLKQKNILSVLTLKRSPVVAY